MVDKMRFSTFQLSNISHYNEIYITVNITQNQTNTLEDQTFLEYYRLVSVLTNHYVNSLLISGKGLFNNDYFT